MKRTSGWRRRPVSRYALLLVTLVAVGGFYASFNTPPRAEAAQGPSKKQVAEGKSLFETSCASCHGLDAQGTKRGPSLYGVGSAAVDFQVGTGRMPLSNLGAQAPRKKPVYSQKQIDALAAYVESLSPGPQSPKGVDKDYKSAALGKGGELFRANCAQCHSLTGQGGALTHGKYAPSLGHISGKHIYEAMQTGPENMPVFGDTLTHKEKLSIIHYVKATDNEPNPGGFGLGRVGPVSEGLVLWILGIGLCIAATIWITAKRRS